MVKYDAEKKAVVVTEELSWEGTVLPLINSAKSYYGDLYEEEEPTQAEASAVEDFLNWEPDEADIEDCMTEVSDCMRSDEWDSNFNARWSLEEALAEWISEQFGFDFDRYKAFPDVED